MARVRLSRDQASRGRLPACCIICAAPAIVYPRQTFFVLVEVWVFLFVVFGPLYLLCLPFFTERARIRTPLCHRHRFYWRWRSLVVWGSLGLVVLCGLGSLVLMVLADRNPSLQILVAPACTGGGLLAAAWVVIAVVVNVASIRSCEINEDFVEIDGVSPAFADAVCAERSSFPVSEIAGEHLRQPGSTPDNEPDTRVRPGEDRIAE